MKKTIEEEKMTVDLVTDAMYSVSFLDALNKEIFGQKKDTLPVREFYRAWLKAVGASETKIPFNLGAFIGYVFCGLLITKENWNDLLPKVTLPELDSDWGLSGVVCIGSKQTNPTLEHFIRRLRNSIAHTNFLVEVPTAADVAGDLERIHDLTVWTFVDVNHKDVADTFEVRLTMRQIELLIKKFHGVIYKSVATKA